MGLQHFDASSSHWQAMAEWCVAHDWPINCHATEAAGHDHPGSVPTPLQEFVRMAESAPSLKLILAHWGGGLAFFEQNPRLRRILSNVYYDCSASPLLYDMRVFKQMVELVSINKLLFGSDYPLKIYPRKLKKPEMTHFIQSVRHDSGLSQAGLDRLLGMNFLRLINGKSIT
jgi:predicted TIM-barrel fold metal-dependent hydrolase